MNSANIPPPSLSNVDIAVSVAMLEIVQMTIGDNKLEVNGSQVSFSEVDILLFVSMLSKYIVSC